MKADGNTRIYVCGVGGQGSLTASRLLGEAALADDLPVTVSEVHGMSQRGGIVESTVLIGGAKSPLIGRGDADALLAFEPMEALRARDFCSDKTVAVVNTRPIIPFTVALGQGEYPDADAMLEKIRGFTAKLYAFDATQLAEKAGNAQAVNAVLMGAMAALKLLPIKEETLRRIVTQTVPEKFRATNEKAYDLGYAQI
jgi:indolepyruvate ferredoxin oxidoreductase, beta subunit